MKDINLKTKIIIIACCVVVIATIGIYIYKQTQEDKYEYYYDTEENVTSENYIEETNDNIQLNTIMVHVTGEVKSQGVVILTEGQRVVDAIQAAGGETNNADLNKLNLAYVLSDGEKIYVPNKNEENENIEYITTSGGENVTKGGNGMDTQNTMVNVNTATVEQLTTLPGIGESLATRIIAYREENGKFNTIEDIKNVSGIGDSKYENIKNLITV